MKTHFFGSEGVEQCREGETGGTAVVAETMWCLLY